MSSISKTVLIVEDDPDSREMFVELLRGAGYSVIAARTGKDAMAFLAVNPPPDVILLDMFMPEMDGWQFRRAQESDPRLASVPVVVVSAVGAAQNSAVRSGAAAFLPKPVTAEDLLNALGKLGPPGGDPAPEPGEGRSGKAAGEELAALPDALSPIPPARPV